MKIEIEISELNEATRSPWWMIVDPRQLLKTSDEQAVHNVASMITGPFFSREEAESVLKARRHNYGPNAHVYCASGCYTRQYAEKVKF